MKATVLQREKAKYTLVTPVVTGRTHARGWSMLA
jgi:hypothetical protein